MSGSARWNLAGGSHAGAVAAFGAITSIPGSPCGFEACRQSVARPFPADAPARVGTVEIVETGVRWGEWWTWRYGERDGAVTDGAGEE